MDGINKGLSFLVVFGKWAKPSIRWSKATKGLCLGWLSINIHPFDMEDFIYKLIYKTK